MKTLLTDLLKFETINDKPNELYKVIDYVDMYFNDVKVFTKRYEKNKKPSLVVSTKQTKKFDILFSAHLDVVPGTAEQFEPFEKNGKIYARGTSDMKGVAAAIIAAFKELVNENSNKELNIGLMLTTDEEQGGFDGAGYLVNEIGYSADIVFLPDGERGEWAVCTDEKGLVWFNIKVKGKSAHSSKLWQGQNAVEKAIKIYNEIKIEFDKKWSEPTFEDYWKPTLNLSSLAGGSSYNSVPEKAEIKIDIRYPAENKQDDFVKIVDAVCKKYKTQYEVPLQGNPTTVSRDNKYLLKWVELSERKLEIKPELYKTNGASDGRFFAEKDMPILSCKPNCSGIHGDVEWIDIHDLERFKNLIKDWVVESVK